MFQPINKDGQEYTIVGSRSAPAENEVWIGVYGIHEVIYGRHVTTAYKWGGEYNTTLYTATKTTLFRKNDGLGVVRYVKFHRGKAIPKKRYTVAILENGTQVVVGVTVRDPLLQRYRSYQSVFPEISEAVRFMGAIRPLMPHWTVVESTPILPLAYQTLTGGDWMRVQELLKEWIACGRVTL